MNISTIFGDLNSLNWADLATGKLQMKSSDFLSINATTALIIDDNNSNNEKVESERWTTGEEGRGRSKVVTGPMQRCHIVLNQSIQTQWRLDQLVNVEIDQLKASISSGECSPGPPVEYAGRTAEQLAAAAASN